jgi:hypothetical protein
MPTTVTPYTDLFTNNLLPATALFDSTTPTVTVPGNPMLSTQLTALLGVPSNPLFALGFGDPFLVNNSVRVSYTLDAASDPDGTATGGFALAATAPTYPLRLDLWKNAMRSTNWAPASPTLLCGGENDPSVFFLDTTTMAGFWSALPTGLVNVLDIDPATAPSGPFAAIQAAFQASQAQQLAFLQTAPGGMLSLAAAEQTLVTQYHGTSVPPFCTLAARSFFSQF